jgi:hypothetical protein
MSTWQPPCRRRGQFKLTLLPPTRASNSVTASRPPGPGSTAALRTGSRDLCTPRPAADPGLAGRLPRWGRALRATPSQPSPTVSTSTTPAEDPASGNRPNTTTASPTDGAWRGRAAFALLGWGNNPSMVVLRGTGRRRAAGAEPMVRAFGDTRTCAEDGCTAQLSRYNPARCCALHQGWDRQVVTRPRRHRP